MDTLKGNSEVGKIKVEEKKPKIEPVTSNVVVKKESEFKKFRNQFMAEDGKTVRQHLFREVFVPGLQRVFSDIVKNGIDWLIYGIKGGPRQGSGSGIRGVTYTDYSDRERRYSSPTKGSSRNNIYAVNDVVFKDRGEAEEVLLRLREEAARYGGVSVGDFYDAIDQRTDHTDFKYGWPSLDQAEVVRSYDGYSIKFPKIVPLE